MEQAQRKKIISISRKVAFRLLDCLVIGVVFFFGVNYSIVAGTRKDILQGEDITQPLDAIVILGASVQGLQLSPILQDRVETGIQLYQRGKAKKIIISGDNGKRYYNEVDAMYAYVRNRGVPPEDIVTDSNGLNTYLSIVNTRQLSDLKTLGIVTQEFHLPRAIFIAQGIGIDAVGIVSDRASYNNSDKYATREMFARIKAFFQVLWWHIS